MKLLNEIPVCSRTYTHIHSYSRDMLLMKYRIKSLKVKRVEEKHAKGLKSHIYFHLFLQLLYLEVYIVHVPNKQGKVTLKFATVRFTSTYCS